MKFLNVILSEAKNLAVLSVVTLLLASCSVYDNYDIDLMQDATASIDSSSSKGESQGNENDGEKSSSSGETSGASSSSVKNDDSSSSSKKDTTYVVIVNPSSSSQKVESAGSSAVENPGSSSSKVPDPIESSSSEAGFPCGDSTMTRGDVDYATVKINNLCWTAENLRYKPAGQEKGYVCGISDDPDCATYGLLYNYETAESVCPDGWRLPTKGDLDKLHTYLQSLSSDFAGGVLKSTSGWKGEPGNGSDKVHFNGLPAGQCTEEDGCEYVGSYGYWWTSTESSFGSRHVLKLGGDSDAWYNNSFMDEEIFVSIRCVKD